MQRRFNNYFPSPEHCFKDITERLLETDKIFGCYYSFDPCKEHDLLTKAIFDMSWYPKTAWKGGEELPWGTFLIEAVFPERLYGAAGHSLSNMLKDKRLYDCPSATSKATNHSHFGRMCRDRDVFKGTGYNSYMQYAIDRWSRGNHRSMPHYYFDVESPEWMFEELFRNKNQIKSGRTATSCSTNFSFRYDTQMKATHVYQILKHSQYSHIFGDLCGTAALARAFCKEVRVSIDNCFCHVFAVSVSMDGRKEGKAFLENLGAR